jgi:hypothetical protein
MVEPWPCAAGKQAEVASSCPARRSAVADSMPKRCGPKKYSTSACASDNLLDILITKAEFARP